MRTSMRCAVGVLLLAPAVMPGQARAAYEIRPGPQQRFALEVFKSGIWAGRKHQFLFGDYHGVVRFDRAAPENSTVEITIEGASALCQDTWVSQSDLGKIQRQAFDMMDVPKHPRLVFSSQRMIPLGGGRFRVEGSLEIGGIARPVVVEVVLVERDQDTLEFQSSAAVRMKDYGLKPPSAALGLIGTKDEMKVEFALLARRAG